MSDSPSETSPAPASDDLRPGNLPVSLGVSLVVALVGTAIWGFPGLWALTSLVPGFIVGSTLAHLIRALRGIHNLRPGVLALGLFLGVTTTVAALAVQAAANSPADQRIERRVYVNAPKEVVWDWVRRAEQRVAWSVLVNDVEPIGRGDGEATGSRYRATLNVDGASMTGEHEVIEHVEGEKVAWRVHFPAGVRIVDFVESIALSETANQTLVSYTIAYRAPSVLARLFNTLRVRSMFGEAAQLSLAALNEKASE